MRLCFQRLLSSWRGILSSLDGSDLVVLEVRVDMRRRVDDTVS